MAIRKIKRQKGTVYRVRVMVKGQRVTKCFYRKYDAMRFEQDVRLDHRVADGLKLKFGDAANQWLENHARPRKAPATVINNEALLRNEIIPTFGNFNLADISPQQIDNFIAKLVVRMSHASVNRRLELIRSIYNYHIRRRNVIYSPMSGVAFLKVDPKPMKFWTLEEVRTFLKHTKEKYENSPKEYIYLLYLLALNTGMRAGELIALKWSAVDFNNRLISVCRSLCHSTGQVRETTKGRRIRHVPINDALIGPLRTAYARRNGVEWVLHTSGSTLDQNNIRKRNWKPDIRESEVSKIRFHDLRHTYASHFLMNGGELFKLQAILGHADVRTTMRYAHFSKAYLLDNANIVRFEAEGNVVKLPIRKSGTND